MNVQNYVDEKNPSITGIVRIYTFLTSVITLCITIYHLRFIIFYDSSVKIISFFRVLICGLFFICAVILFFKPDFWKLFTTSHVLTGFFVIAGGEPLTGCLLFFIGWTMAIRCGFFKQHTRRKIFFAAFLLTAANICNIGFEFQLTLHKILLIVACFTASIVFFVILLEYLKEIKSPLFHTNEPKVKKTRITLSDYNFNYNELYALAATLRDEPYYAISLYLAVSESVVKKMMLNIYGKFGCKNRELFMNKIADCEVVYPEWFKLPN